MNFCRGSSAVKDWKHDSLAPHGEGPYPVFLSSLTAVKVAGITLWIRHMGLKRAYHADLESDEWTAQEDPTDLIPMNPRSP